MIDTIHASITAYAAPFPAQGNSAQTRQAQLREIRNRIESAWLELGAILRESYEAQDWQTLNYKSFADYVEDTLKTSKSEAYDLIRLARISERYPELTPRMLDAGKSNMRLVLPQIANDEDYQTVEQWTDAAAVNSWRDLHAATRESEPPKRYKHVKIACVGCGLVYDYEIEI